MNSCVCYKSLEYYFKRNMVGGERVKGAREFFEVMGVFHILVLYQSINISITCPLAALLASEP